MDIKHFKGYIDGRDITDMKEQYLAYPSYNVLVHKGSVFTRPGLTYFGAPGDTDAETRGWTWKDAKQGELPLRSYNNILQVWYAGKWITIYDALNSHILQYASWIDSSTNPALVKKRLFIVDGSENILDWNGAIAIVKAVSGNTIQVEGGKPLIELGFEDASTNNETVVINGTEYVRNDDGTTDTMTLTTTPNNVNPGDIVYSKVLSTDAGLTGFKKDLIFTYKNHVVVGNFNTPLLYFSHAENKLDFVVPDPANRTALTPFIINLEAPPTAMIDRKDMLWVSTADVWFSINKLDAQNAYGLWVDVKKVEGSNKLGALPRAVANLKDDTIFISQNKTIERITDIEIVRTDRYKLMSDDIEGLMQRLDFTGAEIFYSDRYIYFTVPKEGKILMYDNVEGFWQPPQNIGVSSIVTIEGKTIAHSSSRNESYELFKGDDDVGNPFDAKIAIAYSDFGKEFEHKIYDTFGISGRISTATKIDVSLEHESDGSRANPRFTIDGNKVKTYEISDDDSLGMHPFATRSWAGADFVVKDLKRLFAFKRVNAGAFFEMRPVLYIYGDQIKFQLLAMHINARLADRTRPNDLYIDV